MENRLLRGIQGLRLLSLLTLVQARTREAAPRPPVCTGVGRSGRWASGRCSRVHSLLPALCLTRGSCSEGRDSGVEGGQGFGGGGRGAWARVADHESPDCGRIRWRQAGGQEVFLEAHRRCVTWPGPIDRSAPAALMYQRFSGGVLSAGSQLASSAFQAHFPPPATPRLPIPSPGRKDRQQQKRLSCNTNTNSRHGEGARTEPRPGVRREGWVPRSSCPGRILTRCFVCPSPE